MSHLRSMRIEMRAIFAAALACALIFGLFVSAALHGGAPPLARDANGFAVSCHDRALLATHSSNDDSSPMRRHSDGAGCPDCCLAAHAATAAVLPDRFASFARPMRVYASRMRYFARSTHEMEPAVSRAVNGARAPPVLLALS